MTDKAKVWITLWSNIDGERQQHRFAGEWYRKGRTVFVRYTEKEETGEVRTTVRWRDGELSVTRRGDVESEQTFAVGMRRRGQYVSAHARFGLETDTTLLWMQCGELTQTMADDHAEERADAENAALPERASEAKRPDLMLPMLLEWHYTMWMEDEPTGEFCIRLLAEPV